MYYQGDFYQLPNGRGDPGFFSFIRGLAAPALGSIPVVGPLLGPVASKLAAPSAAGLATAGRLPMLRKGITTAGRALGAAALKHPVLTGAGAAGLGLAAGAGLEHH